MREGRVKKEEKVEGKKRKKRREMEGGSQGTGRNIMGKRVGGGSFKKAYKKKKDEMGRGERSE